MVNLNIYYLLVPLSVILLTPITVNAANINFDDLAPETTVSIINDVHFTSNLSEYNLITVDTLSTTSPTNSLGVAEDGARLFLPGDTITLNFPQPITTITATFISTPLTPPGVFAITTANGSVQSGATPTATLSDESEVFQLTYTSDVPFSSATLGSLPDEIYSFTIDDIVIPNQYNITANISGGQGTIACGNPVLQGGSSLCVITPGSDYYLSKLTDNGVDALGQVSNGSYTIIAVAENHEVNATFSHNPVNGQCGTSNGGTFTAPPSENLCSNGLGSTLTGNGHPWTWSCDGEYNGTSTTCNAFIKTYDLSFIAATNGSLIGSTSQAIDHGGSSSAITAQPATGYHFTNWSGSAGFASSNNPLAINNVTASQSITALFAIDTFEMIANAGSGGSITPLSISATYGSTINYTVVPNTGYHITDVILDNVHQTILDNRYFSHTYSNISEPHNISATFAIDTFTISASINGGLGSLNCTTPANYGSTSSCSIIPNPGYTLTTLADNGKSMLGSVNNYSYLLNRIDSDHLITASFSPAVASKVKLLSGLVATYYSSLMDAYRAINDFGNIQAIASIFTGDFILDKEIAITIDGGNDVDFRTNAGMSTLKGSLTISKGSAIIKNLIVQ